MLVSEPTMHTRTAIVVVERSLPGVKFDVSLRRAPSKSGAQDGLWAIRCQGVGWTVPDNRAAD